MPDEEEFFWEDNVVSLTPITGGIPVSTIFNLNIGCWNETVMAPATEPTSGNFHLMGAVPMPDPADPSTNTFEANLTKLFVTDVMNCYESSITLCKDQNCSQKFDDMASLNMT
jgi:hypothetical protein